MADDIVVKVGGSLFDLPDLGSRLRHWLDSQSHSRILLVPGGGAAADLVREAAKLEGLNEETCHWLALRALTFTAHLLGARLSRCEVIADIAHRERVWQRGQTPILDLQPFARADESRPDRLPHCWDVTSDSLAARVAVIARIPNLVLLKSRSLPADSDWDEAAKLGFVDRFFPELIARSQLGAAVVDFRS